MSKIQSLVTFTIKKGELKKFQKVANRCIKVAKKKDPGTIHYLWYYNAEKTQCLVHESYNSSKSFIQHMKNVNPLIIQLLRISSVSSVAIGKPSKKLLKILSGMKMKIYQKKAGF